MIHNTITVGILLTGVYDDYCSSSVLLFQMSPHATREGCRNVEVHLEAFVWFYDLIIDDWHS